MNFHPHAYQKIAIQRIIDHTHYGLLLDMGLGKTISTLIAIEQLMYDQFDIKKVLLIAPKKVAESTWAQEANKWNETSYLKIASVLGPEKDRIKALQSDSDIYVMNRENVQWLYEYYHKKPFPFDMLVIDESSSFKNPQAKRFKAMRKMRPFFKRVVILTGTPAPNTLMDVWAQMYLLDGGDRLGKTITEYRNRYFKPDKTNGHIVYSYRLLPGGDTAIFGKMQDICMSLKAKDYLTLPERIENVITVEMSPKEWALYKEMERDHVLSLVDDDDVSALNAASLAGKLLQLANGAIYTDEGETIIVHNEKVERCHLRIGNLLVLDNLIDSQAFFGGDDCFLLPADIITEDKCFDDIGSCGGRTDATLCHCFLTFCIFNLFSCVLHSREERRFCIERFRFGLMLGDVCIDK